MKNTFAHGVFYFLYLIKRKRFPYSRGKTLTLNRPTIKSLFITEKLRTQKRNVNLEFKKVENRFVLFAPLQTTFG